MRFPKIIILIISVISLAYGSSYADPFSYPIGFYGGGYPPIYEIVQDGYPGISFYIRFSGFDKKPCDYCPYCPPPSLAYFVRVLWQNPNDPGGDPECWIPAFGAFAYYGDQGFFQTQVFMGTGSITLMDPDPDWPEYYNPCCWSPLKCEGNTWEIKTWPVVSGNYKVELYKWIEDWTFCWWCYDCQKIEFCPWWGPEGHFALVASHIKKITNQSNDFTALTNLFYVSADNQDTLYNGSTMEVMKEYDIVCQIHTTKRIEDIPTQLIGYLEPEDVAPPTQKIFYRDPAGDIPLPCNQNYPLRIHAYRCTDGFMPYELFPGIEPPEWAEITRYLDCKLYGNDNQAYNDIMMRTYVLSYLQLDCTNDSTVCFRPTACEEMEFEFRFGAELGLKPDDDIRFRITDKDDNTVYENPIIIPYMPSFENPFGVPNPAQPHSMRLFWDGRVNMGPNTGHLADPALDSYSAIVEVYEDENPEPIMESNIETFDVVPTIDSLLMTHFPPYFPPHQGTEVFVYSIIKGKVDDSEEISNNFRYYKQEGYAQQNLYIWDKESYIFWDLPSDRQQFYYEDNEADLINLSTWNSEKYGSLEYKWFVNHDYRDYVAGERQRIQYDDVVDTTDSWGNNWMATINTPTQWMEPELQPYMRILTNSEVINKKSNYILQEDKSTSGSSSHKLIFSEYYDIYGRDIVYWAISHIGVPYYILDGLNKIPYQKIECSGLVTACRIQQLGPNNNENFRIGWITATNYLDGTYGYYGIHSTETEQVPATDPSLSRNCLVYFRKRNPGTNDSRHIAIIEDIGFDFVHEEISCCKIIHAYGENGPIDGRVRYDNMLTKLPSRKYYYTFLRWTN